MNRIEYRRMYEAEDQHWWYAGLHEMILEFIDRESRRLGRPLDIFDAGCGTGRLCQLMMRQGHRVAGCDSSEDALRLCSLRGLDNMVLADLNSIELEPGAYDAITSIDVLYHAGIIDDVAVMQRLRRGLKPGGMLVLNLVAHEFLRSTHDIAVHTRERYTKDMLSERLRAAGFEIKLIGYRVGILFPPIALYRLLGRFKAKDNVDPAEAVSDVILPHPIVNGLLLKLLKLENRWIRSGATLPSGSSIFAIAGKSLAADDRQSEHRHAA